MEEVLKGLLAGDLGAQGWRVFRELIDTCNGVNPQYVWYLVRLPLPGRQIQAMFMSTAGFVFFSQRSPPCGLRSASAVKPAFLASRPFGKSKMNMCRGCPTERAPQVKILVT